MISLSPCLREMLFTGGTGMQRSIDALHPAAGYIQFGFETHPRAREIMRSISVDEVAMIWSVI